MKYRNWLNSPSFPRALFLLGLAARLLLIPFFGSYYLKDLFIPFLDQAVLHPTENPWSHFPPNYFPYGTSLFVLLFVPRFLFHLVFGSAALGTGALGLALVKLPLLGFDLLLYREIKKQVGDRNNPMVEYLYWLNPITIYISYVHGQLDIVSMAFCFLCLSHLIRKKYTSSAILGGLAVTSKFHVAVAFPLCVAYLWNSLFLKDATKKILTWSAIIGAIAFLGFYIPMRAGTAEHMTVGSPEFFRLFALQLPLAQNLTIHLSVVAVLLLVARISLSSTLYPQGLVFGSGAIFAAILLTTNAMPGWFFWVLPFYALFYARFPLAKKSLYLVAIGFYFVIYCAVPAIGPHMADTAQFNFFSSIVWTTFQVLMLLNLIFLWTFAIRHEAVLEGRSTPFIIGVAGDSGSGKSRLSEAFQHLFGEKGSVMVEGDDYHKWERHDRNWRNFTHLSPEANFLPHLSRNIRLLRRGSWFFQRRYDHNIGAFTEPELFKAKHTIIVQGLHTFYLRGLKELLDIKIFLSPDEQVRLAWKIKRDQEERGHDQKKIVESFKKRKKDSETFIAPQRAAADWIIEHRFAEEVTDEQISRGVLPGIVTSHLLWNDEQIWRMLDELQKQVEVHVEYLPDRPDWIRVVTPSNVTSEQIGTAADRIFWNLKNTTKSHFPPEWTAGWEGICQLILLTLMNKRLYQDQVYHNPSEWMGGAGESLDISDEKSEAEEKIPLVGGLFEWLAV